MVLVVSLGSWVGRVLLGAEEQLVIRDRKEWEETKVQAHCLSTSTAPIAQDAEHNRLEKL